mmetsp:Transcript_68034/g.76169  ORF Transcript_68034/g.76169 Transcript_68034/m.76169 type:complete len:423 (+) Transcript_68034:52-1320(+)
MTEDLKLSTLMVDMLHLSNFAYSFRDVRAIVRNYDTTVGDGRLSKVEPEKRVKFARPELIITDNGDPALKDPNHHLLYEVTPNAILTFMKTNRKYFKPATPGSNDLVFDKDMKEDKEPFYFETQLKNRLSHNMKIIDYDDSCSGDVGGFVYGIIVDVTRKWVCVYFRGTVAKLDVRKLNSDMVADRNFELNTKLYTEDTTFPPDVGSHSGFTKYLFDPCQDDAIKGRHMFDRIIASISDVFKTNPDVAGNNFKLVTTGHSLGASLANLFAFHVAHKKQCGDTTVADYPKSISAITFAAPVVGNKPFNTAYQSLEKEGYLRHARFSNENDIIPTNAISAPYRFFLSGNTHDYIQNGVNFFLKNEGKMHIEHGNTKEFKTQSYWLVVKNAPNHSLLEYTRRVYLEENKEDLEQTMEEIYEKYYN